MYMCPFLMLLFRLAAKRFVSDRPSDPEIGRAQYVVVDVVFQFGQGLPRYH